MLTCFNALLWLLADRDILVEGMKYVRKIAQAMPLREEIGKFPLVLSMGEITHNSHWQPANIYPDRKSIQTRSWQVGLFDSSSLPKYWDLTCYALLKRITEWGKEALGSTWREASQVLSAGYRRWLATSQIRPDPAPCFRATKTGSLTRISRSGSIMVPVWIDDC